MPTPLVRPSGDDRDGTVTRVVASVSPIARHTPRLSNRIFRLLVHGDVHQQYRDDLAVVGAITADAARAGHDYEHLRILLADERNAGGAWYRRRVDTDGQLRADRALQRMFDRSVAQCQRNLADATEVRILLWAIQQAAVGYPWQGRAGVTRFKVFVAHTSVAMRAGRLTYRASTRQLAEAAGVFRTVVQIRNSELRTLGLIRLVEPARGTRATTWAIPRQPWSQPDPVGATVSRSINGSCSHDAFRHGTGLDARTWCALDLDDAITVAELALVLDANPPTLRARLRRLKAVGLAAHDDDGTWRKADPPDLLDNIAEATGMVQRSQRQRERHRAERADHREHLQRRAQRKGGQS